MTAKSAAILPASGILVLAPHPDDEVLGCGGLLALAADRGTKICIAYLTDGSKSHDAVGRLRANALAAIREQEALAGLKALGVHQPELMFLRRPDGALDGDEVVQSDDFLALRQAIHVFNINVALVTDRHDDHPDHKAAFAIAEKLNAVEKGLRVFSFPVTQRLAGKTAALPPDCFIVEIESVAARKRAALLCHKSQIGALSEFGHGFALSAQDIDSFCTNSEWFLPMTKPGGLVDDER